MCYVALLAVAALALASSAEGAAPSVRLRVNKPRVGMGRAVELRARATFPDGSPAAGYLLLPYVNGKRWGANEYADERGRATFHIPLPNPDLAEIVVEARPSPLRAEEWITLANAPEHATYYLQCVFDLPRGLAGATLWAAADDSAKLTLNGTSLGDVPGWVEPRKLTEVGPLLRAGRNVLSAEVFNYTGPTGLLIRLEAATERGPLLIVSNPSWRAFAQRPGGWPSAGDAAAVGSEAVSLGSPDATLWASTIKGWPTLTPREALFAGYPLPGGAHASAPVRVWVDWRRLQTMPVDRDHLVGMQWEPWFTPHNAEWSTGQAVPLVGRYWSWNHGVTRQHMIWLIESGIDFLVVDWTNHLWGKAHWDERPDATNEIVLCTTLALETLAELRDEGCPVPKMVIYPGLNNGPETTTEAVSEELAWIHHNYIRNPRFHDLFVDYLGKPLVMIHNGGGPGWIAAKQQPPVDDRYFTIRWQSSQSDSNHLNEQGYWSWMDGSLTPTVTRFRGEPECLTVCAGLFSGGGWKAPTAYGHRNGWTYVESFKVAMEHRPRFLELHQFNEFAGQPEGGGYGPNHDIYVDSYSSELCDDMEPVSLTAPAYRGDGGWGFLFLNLTRALVDLYRQETPETTVVAIGRPLNREVIAKPQLQVQWTSIGAPARCFTLALDGRPVARDLTGTQATLDLSHLRQGRHLLTLTAEGTRSRYILSYTEDSLPLEQPVPASATLEFVVRR
jgi:hypothetical protein